MFEFFLSGCLFVSLSVLFMSFSGFISSFFTNQIFSTYPIQLFNPILNRTCWANDSHMHSLIFQNILNKHINGFSPLVFLNVKTLYCKSDIEVESFTICLHFSICPFFLCLSIEKIGNFHHKNLVWYFAYVSKVRDGYSGSIGQICWKTHRSLASQMSFLFTCRRFASWIQFGVCTYTMSFYLQRNIYYVYKMI
jgi:hypothetical protein